MICRPAARNAMKAARMSNFNERSCRRRLAGHNERRRKPQVGSLLSAQYGSSSIFGNDSGGGSFLIDFSTYPRHTGKVESGSQDPGSGSSLLTPWQNNSASRSPELQRSNKSITYPGHAVPPGGCFDGSNLDVCSLAVEPRLCVVLRWNRDCDY